MKEVTEGKLKFFFADEWNVSQYDQWAYYKRQFIKMCSSVKAVDVLALESRDCCWLLEVKDYREHTRTKAIDLADEIAEKVRDTLAGLAGAQCRANNNDERSAARQALRARSLRIVLHLEQPAKHSKIFPRPINPAAVLQRLKQLIKAVDSHPRVVQMNAMEGIPWKVTSL